MPKGTTHTELGVLLKNGRQLVLQRDGGGCWRLEAPRYAERLIGSRVEMSGIREGFDLLAVKTICKI